MPDTSADPYAPPQAKEAALGRALPWLGDVLLLLALQIGLTVSASATAWFTIREPRYTLVFAAIPAGAMLFALLRRRRALIRVPTYRRLLTAAGAIGWGATSGLFLLWLKFIRMPGARLSAGALFVGFDFLWLYYAAATLFGLWSGSHGRKGKMPV